MGNLYPNNNYSYKIVTLKAIVNTTIAYFFKIMKKILFYITIVLSLRLAYVIYDIVIYQLVTLNAYGIGFLVGKIVLLLILIFVINKTNPFKKLD